MKYLRLLLHAVLLILFTATAYAQTTVGTIYGSVTDNTGAKLPAADITIMDVKTGVKQTGKANSQGDYQFPAVNPSNYIVTATVDGFKTETQTGIIVDANDNVDVSFALTPGGVSEKVDITAGTTLVDTREAQIGETIDQQRIEDLPTINRDPYELLQTVTGTSGFTSDIVIGSRQGVGFSINGLPVNTSSYYLDGAQNNILRAGGGNKAPNPSALQEFRIITSNADAEFGRSPGALVNLITKSGTDAYHGEVYEFLRNNMFDQEPYFAPPGTIINYHQNQFGAVSGGPIPSLHQTFFFVSFEHFQLHQDNYVFPSQWTVPTPAMASGDFSADPLVLSASAADQNNVKKLSCNGTTLVICSGNLDKLATNVMSFVPKANPTTGVSPTEQAPADNQFDQGLGRIDYNGIAHHSIEGTFFDSRGSALDPTAGGTNQVFSYDQKYLNTNQVNGIVADNWVISNNTVNSLRGFYTGNRDIISNMFLNHLATDLGGDYPSAAPQYLASPPRFDLSEGNYVNIGGSSYGPSDINQQSWGLVDVATIQYKQHSIKVGASYIWDKYSENGTRSSDGVFTISGDPGSFGDRYVDFLIGDANSFSQDTPAYFRRHNYDPAIFAQDNWHIFPRLTLDLGLRWEVFSPFYGDDTSGSFRAGVQSVIFPTAPLGILYQGDPGVPVGVANTPYNDFAPRFGFAWDVYGDGRTSLRGGFGLFYYQQVVDDENNYQQPYGLDITLDSPAPTSYVNPYLTYSRNPGVSPFPYVANPKNPIYVAGGTVYQTPPNGGSTPYAQEFNLSIQQQLTPTYALQIAYVGNRFIKQLQSVDVNTPPLPTPAQLNSSIPCVDSRRPYQPYGYTCNASVEPFYFQNIEDQKNELNTYYNGLQVTLRGRLGHKINLNASYVWSKDMDNESPIDPANPHSSYGPAGVDIRGRFVMSGLFALPNTSRFGWFGTQVLSGWRVNDITYIQSGTPFTVTTSTDESFDNNTSSNRPNVIGDPYTHAKTRAEKIHEWINPSAFQVITRTMADALAPSLSAFYGDEQRNQLRLPYTTNTNFSMFKEFALPHQTRLQFRAECFNLLGNVNLTSPRTDLGTISTSTNIANPAFDQLQNAEPMREYQFGLRFLY